MTQLTQSSGLGYSLPFNAADFARDFLGVPATQRTWNSGLGFSRAYFDVDYARADGGPGGDVTAVTSEFSGIITGTIEEIDGFDVVIEAFGGLTGFIGAPSFTIERLDVDDIDLPLTETGLIEFTWV